MSVLEDRVYVAGLIRQVLISRLCVREAILNFPRDTEDKSIQSAFHALVHYEADEDLRARDSLYREEQDDYLEFISYVLERGEDLPENIIENYEKYYVYASGAVHGSDAVLRRFCRRQEPGGRHDRRLHPEGFRQLVLRGRE